MAEKFNPLKSWLGITSSEKPSYYDLIGLANFESEPPIIADAADSAIAKVSENLGGEHHAIAEKLVRDLKSLKSVLLSADKRRAYDEQLAKKLGLAPPTPGPALPGMGAAIDAADSPTMMLPPGALSGMRSLDQVLNSAPPGAAPSFPPGAAPAPFGAPGFGGPNGGGQPMGVAPFGAPPQPQFGAPPYGNQPFGAPQGPGYGDRQYGAPQQQPYGAPGPAPFQQPPYGVDPNVGFNPAGGFPQPGFPQSGFGPSGQPQQGSFGAPQQPMFPGQMPQGPMGGAPFGPGPMNMVPMNMGPMNSGPMNSGPMNSGPMNPGPMGGQPFGAPAPGGLGGPIPMPGDSLGLGGAPPGMLPRGPAPKTRARKAPVAKTQNSNLTVAFGVLGVAAVVLVVVIIVVLNNREDKSLTALQPGRKVVRDTVNKPVPYVPSNVAPLRNPMDIVQVSPQEGAPTPKPADTIPVTIDISKEMDPRERRGPGMNPDNLVTMLTGGKPIGTGAMPAPSGTAKPPASEMDAPKSPDGLKGVVLPQVAMEATLPEDAARAKAVPTMLKGARGSLKARDYTKAEEAILLAQITADTPALIRRAQEHQRALDLIRSFWSSVHAGIKTLKAGDELSVSGKTATVVKHDDSSLTVKLDGKDIPLVIEKMAPGLAVQLAERALDKDAAGTKLVVGTFLAIDQGADASHGMAMIESAAGGEIIVEDFLAMLKSTD